ncbi:unnamed protein product [Ascophyllum nodosum]
MGSVDAKARNTLQETVHLVATSGKDVRLSVKKILVHACANLDVDRCVSLLEATASLGQDAALQLLWLYERYGVPTAGGSMTKCACDHFGRDLGKMGHLFASLVIEEIIDMPGPDKEALALQLADWDPIKRVQVLTAWEAADPKMSADDLVSLMQQEQINCLARGGDKLGSLWRCSLCSIKRKLEMEAKLKWDVHRRKGHTVSADVLYDYRSESRGVIDVYRSPHESPFGFAPPRKTGMNDRRRWDPERDVGAGTKTEKPPSRDACDSFEVSDATAGMGETTGVRGDLPPRSTLPTPTYAGREFDPCRLCKACTNEWRSAIIFRGHDLELWHAVDDERRALLELQRRNDIFKAEWAKREWRDRQVCELLRFIVEANLDSFSRHSLEEREKAAHSTQAKPSAELRRMLDLKLSYKAAVENGAAIDEELKRLSERRTRTWASTLRLKASLNLDRHYASLGPGGLPASLERRHNTSTKRSDFLADGTPVTPQGAKQTFGRAGPDADDESEKIWHWKSEAQVKEGVLERRREVRAWQLLRARQARFEYLSGRWVDAARDIEEKQRQTRMLKVVKYERRVREKQAAKLERIRQLAELRKVAGMRAAREERRRLEWDRQVEERRKRESRELELMRREEAAQLAGGDRFWGLVHEMQRLRAVEEKRRLAWEARVKSTREKMIAVRCISKLSDFGHALPPKDPLLAQKIEILAAMLGKNTRGRGSFKSPSLPVENSTICET